MNEEKIENMLTQLIKMVENMRSDQQEMKQDMQAMQRDQQEMRQDIQEIKQDQNGLHLKIEKLETKNEERHQEIVARFKALENDHDCIWEKTARNERDLANIKRQINQ
jgi:chromosome segregation ATPase